MRWMIHGITGEVGIVALVRGTKTARSRNRDSLVSARFMAVPGTKTARSRNRDSLVSARFVAPVYSPQRHRVHRGVAEKGNLFFKTIASSASPL
jgi:hypothetical protein